LLHDRVVAVVGIDRQDHFAVPRGGDHRPVVPSRIRVGPFASESVEVGVWVGEVAEELVKRPVLERENNDMLRTGHAHNDA
jgi:hypothetical protein